MCRQAWTRPSQPETADAADTSVATDSQLDVGSSRHFCGRPGDLRGSQARTGQPQRRHARDRAARRLTHAQPAAVAGQAAADPLGRAHQVRDASATPHGAAVSDGDAIPGQRSGHTHHGGDASSLRHQLGGSDFSERLGGCGSADMFLSYYQTTTPDPCGERPIARPW